MKKEKIIAALRAEFRSGGHTWTSRRGIALIRAQQWLENRAADSEVGDSGIVRIAAASAEAGDRAWLYTVMVG